MSEIIIPIEKRETEEEKTILDLADEPAIKLAPAVPGAPDNMIQKHVDNFLAKIAGETPVDDNPRDSTEYWLNKIAESRGGGGLYSHVIKTTDTTAACSVVYTSTGTSFTATTFAKWLYDRGFVNSNRILVASGKFIRGGDTQIQRYCGFCSENGTTLLLIIGAVDISPTVSVNAQSVQILTIIDTVTAE